MDRYKKLAHGLVNYSVSLKKGEKILVESTGADHLLVNEIIKEVYALGAFPFVQVYDTKIQRQILMGTNKDHCDLMAKYASFRMKDMDAYIGIRGGDNSFEYSDVPDENNRMYSKYYAQPVHHDLRVDKTKWVILRYPVPSFAQLAGMSTEGFANFFFDVCNLDYSKMDKAMDPLKKLMEKTDKVRITAKDTDISFSIKGIPAKKCAGKCNITDGEIYTAPVKDSVNGVITYNAPSVYDGVKFENVRLKFKNGRIVEASSNFTDKMNKIFDTDEGARFAGEFAIGVNPFIVKPMGDILFDEKISGSIHFTPGSSYKEAYNGNESAIHWDLVLIQTEEYGGGEIYFDNLLIRKNGFFVVKELEGLNPGNLK